MKLVIFSALLCGLFLTVSAYPSKSVAEVTQWQHAEDIPTIFVGDEECESMHQWSSGKYHTVVACYFKSHLCLINPGASKCDWLLSPNTIPDALHWNVQAGPSNRPQIEVVGFFKDRGSVCYYSSMSLCENMCGAQAQEVSEQEEKSDVMDALLKVLMEKQ